MLDSVQGVEGGLKFDPSTGGFVTGGSVIQEFDAHGRLLFSEKSMPMQDPECVANHTVSVPDVPYSERENSDIKLEDNDVYLADNQLVCRQSLIVPNSGEGAMKKAKAFVDFSQDSKSMALDDGSCQMVKSQGCPKQAYNLGPVAKKDGNAWGLDMNGQAAKNSGPDNVSWSSSSLVADEIENIVDGDNGIVEHSHPTSSNVTDSSNGSGSMIHGSSSGAQSSENPRRPKVKSVLVESGSKIIVKATYKDDTVRFRFDPSAGCFQLYEEVATRFKLHNGSFQLKYLDDEEEWVMLVNDSDLQECVEILEDMSTSCAKFLVRDMPFLSSSGSSSSFLQGS